MGGTADTVPTPRRPPTTGSAYRLAAVGFVLAHLSLVAYGGYRHSPTRNEVAHVPAGLAVWTTGTFTLYRVNPPLPRALAAVPPLLAGADTRMIRPADRLGYREEWQTAAAFADGNADRYLTLIRLARLPGLLWTAAGAWVVWRWAGELHGPRGGLTALGVWCFGPTVNAHAQLATPDLPAAVAMLAATFAYRRHLRHPTVGRAAAAGGLLGVALLCKFTSLVLLPVWAALAAAVRPAAGDAPRPSAGRRAGLAGLVLVTAVTAVNAGYLFDGALVELGAFEFNSRLLGGPERDFNRFRGGPLAGLPVPLPYDYVTGIDWQRVDFEGGLRSYLCGEWRDRGWWYWYLYATAVKVPAGVLILGLAGLAAAAVRPTADGLIVWLPVVAVFGVVSVNTGMTQHWRYALPALPFAAVGLGAAGRWLSGRRPVRFAVGGLLVWAAVSGGRVYPHTLSYFNEAAGGPARGWWHLTDSNVDWGQDLLFLREWAAAHPEARPLSLGYSNFVSPRHVGVDLPPAPVDPGYAAPAGSGRGPQPGYYAVEASSLVSDRTLFQRFTPIDQVGYSILIYSLTPAEAAAARTAMGFPATVDATPPDQP
jgi:hypothetical protein